MKTQKYSSDHFSKLITENENQTLLVTVKESLQEKNSSYKAILKVDGIINDNETVSSSGIVLCYFAKDSFVNDIKYGDQLVINTQVKLIQSPANPAQFDYQNYLHLNQMYYQVYLRKINGKDIC